MMNSPYYFGPPFLIDPVFSLDSNVNHEINVSPGTVTKFPKLPKLILFVKNHVFNTQIRKNNIKNWFYKT
jgi:hypothetical protein